MFSNKFGSVIDRGVGGRLLAYLMVATLLLTGLVASGTADANAASQGTVVGKVAWNGVELTAGTAWTSNVSGQIAGSGSGAAHIQMSNTDDSALKISNVAVSANSGVYFTPEQNLGVLSDASTDANDKYEVEQTVSVYWAARDSEEIVEIEIPVAPGFSGTDSCGMEVNPSTSELIIPNSCGTNGVTNFMVFNPGADGDPSTIGDNSFRIIVGSGGALDSESILPGIVLDAQGNIYVVSEGTSGSIFRYDFATGAVKNVGSFTPEDGVVMGWPQTQLGFRNGYFVNISDDNSGLSLGINPLTLKSTMIPDINFAGTGLDGSQSLDGSGTQGVVTLQGTVFDTNARLGLADQVVALYSSNGDGTGTLAATSLTDTDGSYLFLLDSADADYYARVVQPQLVTDAQTKNGEVVSIETSLLRKGQATASEISSVSGDLGVNYSLGTVGTTTIDIGETNDLVTFNVLDSKAVGQADFNLAFEGSTADQANNSLLTDTDPAGHGPQHINLDDQLWLGASAGSYLVGTTANDHASDDGVTAVIGGVETNLDNQTFVVGGTYTLKAKSQGSAASSAMINGWVSVPSTTSTVGAWVSETPSMSAGGAAAELKYVVPDSAGKSTLRIDSSLTGLTSPSNSGGIYAATAATADTLPWVTVGEVEDYLVNSANAIVRVKANNNSGTSSYSVSADAGDPTEGQIVDEKMLTTTHLGTNGDVSVSVTAVPDGQTLVAVNLINALTGVSTSAGASAVAAQKVDVSAQPGTDTIVEFVYASIPDYTKSSFTVSETANIVADGNAGQTITVTLLDKDDQPVTGRADQLSAAVSGLGSGSVGAFAETAADSGIYSAKVTSTATGSKTISVTFGTINPATVNANGNSAALFGAGGVDLDKTDFTVSTGDRTANGTATHTVTVSLLDATGNFISGKASSLSATTDGLGSGLITEFEEDSDAYVAAISSTVSGAKTIEVLYDGTDSITVKDNAAASFIPGPVDPDTSTYSVSSGPVEADGLETATITVILRDSFNNVVPGALSGLTATSAGTGVISTIMEESGVYKATVGSVVSGDQEITVKYSGQTVGAGTNIQAHFVSTIPDLDDAGSWFNISTSADAIIADGVGTHRVSVSLTDANGNPVTLADASLANLLVSTSNLGTGIVSGFAAVVGTPGLYEATITSTKTGTKDVSVKYDGESVSLKAAGSSDAIFITGEVDTTNVDTNYSVSPGSQKVTEEHQVTVTLADKLGNPVSGQAGSLFGSATGDASVSGFVESGTTGIYVAQVSSDTPGSKTVTVNYGSGVSEKPVSLLDAGNAVADFVVGDPVGGLGFSQYTVSPNTRVADGLEFHEITVTLLDAKGNPVTGVKSAITAIVGVPGSLGTGVIGEFVETSVGSGVYKSNVTSTIAGTYGFDVQYKALDLNSAGNSFAKFVADIPELTDPLLSNYTVTPGSEAVVSGQHMITVTLKDALGNPVVLDYPGISQLSATADPAAGVTVGAFSATGTEGIYSAPISSTSAGEKNIAVFFDQDGSGSDDPIQVHLQGGGNKIASFGAGDVDLDNVESWFTVSSQVVKVGNSQTITVHLVDSHENPIIGETGLSAVADPSEGVTIDPVFVSTVPGTYQTTVTSTIPGSKTITVSLGTSSVTVRTAAATGGVGNNQAVFEAEAIDTDKSVFTVSSGPVSVEEDHVVTVVVQDKFGNPLSGKEGDLGAAATQVGATFGAFVETATPGTYTAQIQSDVANVYTVSINAGGHALVAKNQEDTAKFVVGGVSALKSTFDVSTGEVAVGGKHYVTVTLRDAKGNVLTEEPAGIDLSAIVSPNDLGTGAVGTWVLPGNTFTGKYQAEITSTKSGVFTVAVALAGNAVSTDGNDKAIFVAGLLSLQDSAYQVTNTTISVDTGNFHLIDVYLNDAYGNPVDDISADATKLAAWTTDDLGTGSISVFVKVANSKGHYQATVGSTVPGWKEIAVSYDSQPLLATGNQTARFSVGPVDFDVANTNFTVTTGDRSVDAQHEITVVLSDKYGNPVSGLSGDLLGVASDLGTVSGFTEDALAAPGVYTAVVTSPKSGKKTIAVTLAGTDILVNTGGNSVASFVAAAVDVDSLLTTYKVTDDERPVDQYHLVTVFLADSKGNGVGGQADSLQAVATGGATTGAFIPTGTIGEYQAKVNSDSIGHKTVMVAYNTKTIVARDSANTVARFVAGKVDLTNLGTSFSVTDGERVADGIAFHEIKVTLVDAKGNPVADSASKLSAVATAPGVLGTGVVTAFAETATDGVYIAQVVSSKSGDVAFKVTFTDGGIGARVTQAANANWIAVFVPGEVSFALGKSSFSVSLGTATVGAGEHKITVRLQDANGNPVMLNGAQLTKLVGSADPSGGVTLHEFSATDIPGVYSAQVGSQASGTKLITVELAGSSITAVGNNKATWADNSVDSDAYETWFTVFDSKGSTDYEPINSGYYRISVNLVDRHGDPVTGQADSLSAVAAPGTGVTIGVFDEVAKGFYETVVRSSSPGSKQITIFQGGSQIYVRSSLAVLGAGNDIARFGSAALDPDKSTFTVSEGDVPVQGGTHEVRVNLVDSWGNPIVGEADRIWAYSPGNSGVKAKEFTEISPGYYTTQLSSDLAGKFSITVKLDGAVLLSVAAGGNTFALFTDDAASVSESSFTVSSGNKTVGAGSHTITVTLKNAQGVAVTDGLVALSASVPSDQPLGSGGIGEFVQAMNGDGSGTGVYTAAITSTKSGGKDVSVRIGGSEVAPANGSNTVANFIAGGLVDEKSFYSVSDGTRIADGTDAHTVTVNLNDKYSNPVTGQAAILVAEASPADTLPLTVFAESTLVPGQYQTTVLSNVSGNKEVSVTVDGRTLSAHGSNRTARFIAGSVVQANSEFQVSNGSAAANGVAAHTVTVTLRDANMNPVILPKDQLGMIRVALKPTFSLGTGGISALRPNGDGTYVAKITSTVSNEIPLWVSVYGTEIDFVINDIASFTSNQWSPNADKTYFEVSQDAVVADGVKTVEITIHLADSHGNPVNMSAADIATMVAVTTDQIGGGQISEFAASSGKNGTYTATITSTLPGVKTLKVSVGITSLDAKTKNTKATFLEGAAALDAAGTGYKVSAGAQPVLGGTHTVTVVTTDSTGNFVDVVDLGKLIATSSDNLGNGSISAFTRISKGTYSATVKSNRVGPKEITVAYDGIGLHDIGNKIALFDGEEKVVPAGTINVDGAAEVGATLGGKMITSTWVAGTTCAYQWQSNGMNILGETTDQYVIKGIYVNTVITLVATCSNPDYTDAIVVTSNKVGLILPKVTRIGGVNRYGTSARVNEEFGQKGGILFIATGQVYADALSAGPAVAVKNGSLMLTSTDSLSPEIRQQIQNMKPTSIYIMGGTNSVSEAVETELKTLTVGSVGRIGGKDRYETSYKIYEKFFGATTDAYVATGNGFADALVASAAAGYLQAPVILVDGKNSAVLDTNVRELLTKRAVANIHIAGGLEAVNANIMVDSQKYFKNVTRESGVDRYATAIEINRIFTANYFEHVWIATGMDFPDALSGAVPAGSLGEPIFLSKPECLSPQVVVELENLRYGERIILGGKNTLSDSVLTANRACL